MSQKRIFINYRRSDSSGHAGRLHDYLRNYLGDERIFFDVATIQAGVNFEQKINNELDNSEAVLVLIGNQWLDSKNTEGNRRLDNPQDYVRFEIETALSKNIPVIPILLQGAEMPSKKELPDALSDLSRHNAIRLNDDHWYSDCNLLAGLLKNTLHVSRSLKERKIRRYRLIVFALSALVTLLTMSFFTFGFGGMLYIVLSLVLGLAVISNVALVTYLLGNIKKELDRLSWAIIGIAILGAITVAWSSAWGSPLGIWVSVMMILEAGLLNFIEPDE